jgi:hypothetical protein
MRALKIALVAAALGAAAACTGSASAMPVGGLAAASNELANDMVQDVRWCGRFRCRGYPRYYTYRPYYYYSPYYAYYGWPYYRPYWGLGWGWGALWW